MKCPYFLLGLPKAHMDNARNDDTAGSSDARMNRMEQMLATLTEVVMQQQRQQPLPPPPLLCHHSLHCPFAIGKQNFMYSNSHVYT